MLHPGPSMTQQENGVSQGVEMNAEDEPDATPDQPKFLGLSRCAACYNQSSWNRRGGDGESSSSAEDSGPDAEDEEEEEEESEAESSSSSSHSEKCPEPEDTAPEPAPEPALESAPEPAPEEQVEVEETSESQADGPSNTKRRRACLVKSASLPESFSPRLLRPSLLPRPHTVVSTLHLQVEVEPVHDAFSIVKQDQAAGQPGPGYPPLPLQLPWQPPPLQQHQLLPHHQPPLSAQGQRLPPLPPLPVHTLPPNVLCTHLNPLAAQPCWQCYGVQSPYGPY